MTYAPSQARLPAGRGSVRLTWRNLSFHGTRHGKTKTEQHERSPDGRWVESDSETHRVSIGPIWKGFHSLDCADGKNQAMPAAREVRGLREWVLSVGRRLGHLLHTQRDGLQSFFEFSTLLTVSTIWGICFSLKANPSGSNPKSFDTVLPWCDRARTITPRCVHLLTRSSSSLRSAITVSKGGASAKNISRMSR